MIKIQSINELKSAKIPIELFTFLMKKIEIILEEYGLSDIGDVFSVIVLTKNEIDYLSDKYLEFNEVITIGDTSWIHTVWAASDGYSEDIYIPCNDTNIAAIEKRCL